MAGTSQGSDTSTTDVRTGATGHVSPSIRPGDLLAGRYRLEDLLSESQGGRFWRAHDRVLDRHVAVHCLAADDERAPELLDAARRSAAVLDRCILRVLDADERDDVVFVVNEWGDGASLDILLAGDGPLDPRQAAWIAAEVGGSLAAAHEAGVAHGRLNPENVLLDHNGHVRLIGLGVEAALWGLPQRRVGVDIVDLAAVLYAGLTGRWAGVSSSVVPRAPTEHGRVLRPRQVRAGIPRPLDSLCDEVINPGGIGAHARAAYDLATSRGISDYLRAFVGDGGDLPPLTARQVRRVRAQWPTPGGAGLVAELAAEQTAEHEPIRSEPTPDGPEVVVPEDLEDLVVPHDPDRTDVSEVTVALPLPAVDEPVTPVPETSAGTDQPSPAPAEPATGPAEQPTELGMPIFDDESDEVGWLTARASPPPPPPPFDAHPERPLFAPEPAPGEPARRARPGVPTASAEYVPWETGTGTGAPVTTGTGSGPLYLDEEEPDDGVPGRSALRLGIVILVTLLLVLVALVGVNLLQGRSPLSLGPDSGGSESSSPPSTGAGAATALTGLTAFDLDPQGDPPEENPDLAALAVDGDPATDWHTSTYEQNLGPAGLKTGVGLVVDVGKVRELQELSVQLVGSPTGLTVLLADDRPSSVRGLEPVATETADGTLQVALDGASGRYVVLWLTSLPRVGGGFRGGVAEVVVSG